ncbi:pentatricopeptide repeat-containing protein At5g40410, mitochondrial-like [Benincasa hispida]|uniref:pentatricopeptide repeat-containing protein At5g40410, mitochondrial-like n=1 Tax=Benincasa hispida TaxID=102211 RepID=UPI0019004A2C|nr:pentatricopeptide repeat-containing protein At5g40410, mitochondrial-like [Benincasa hispida]
MQKVRKFASFVRTITTATSEFLATTSPIHLPRPYSHLGVHARDVIYLKNREINKLIKLGHLNSAIKLFDEMPLHDVVTYNLLISGCLRNGHPERAFGLYSQMVLRGIRESASTFTSVLGTCSNMDFFKEGSQIHCRVVFFGFTLNLFIASSLIDFYMRMGLDIVALKLFDELPQRNIAVWNLLLCRYCELSQRDLTRCRLLHCCAIKSGFEYNSVVSCSLMDSYSKCGQVELSCKIFEEIHSPGVICFTSIINGYARNGLGKEGVEMLKTMIQKGLKPDKVTFLCALIGCNHSGLVEEGRFVFESMKTLHGIEPEWKHYSCMVDLLGRVGLLDEAEKLIQKVPERVNGVIWSSMLRSCRIHGNETIGRKIAKSLVDLEAEDPAILLQASNFYSDIGDFETSKKLREIALTKKVIREIGHSLIEEKIHC